MSQTVAATHARNKAANAVEAAAGAASQSASVDNVQAELDHDSDVAKARFDRVIGGMQAAQSPVQVAALARAKVAIQARHDEIIAEAKAVDSSQEPAPTA